MAGLNRTEGTKDEKNIGSEFISSVAVEQRAKYYPARFRELSPFTSSIKKTVNISNKEYCFTIVHYNKTVYKRI